MDRATAFALIALGVLIGVVAGVLADGSDSGGEAVTNGSVRFISSAPAAPPLPTYRAPGGWASLPEPPPPEGSSAKPIEAEETYEPVEETYEPSYESTPEYSPEPAPSPSGGGHQHGIELTP